MNPYKNRKMIRFPENFHGRTNILQDIYSQLEQEQSISIVGSRRIGKSSVLYCLTLPEIQLRLGVRSSFERTLFVYTDMLSRYKLSPSEFYSVLLEQVYQAKTGKIQEFSSYIGYRHFEQHLDSILQERESIDKSSEKVYNRIIFVMDEFDQIKKNKTLNEELFANFRALCNRLPVGMVTASAEPLYAFPFAEQTAFYNIFQTFPLYLISYGEAYELVEKPSSEAGLSFNEIEKRWILDLAGTHPYYIQLICWYAFKRKQEIKGNLTENDQKEITKKVMQDAVGILDYEFKFLNREQEKFLQQIWLAGNTFNYSQEIVVELERKALITNEENKPFAFFGKILTFYLDKKWGKNEVYHTVWFRRGESQRMILKIVESNLKIKQINGKRLQIDPKSIQFMTYNGNELDFNYRLTNHKIFYKKSERDEYVEGRIENRKIRCIGFEDDKEYKIRPEDIEQIQIGVD